VTGAGFIFDMDGVLADTMPFHVQAWMTVLAEHGLHKTREEFLRDTGGTTNAHILRQWFGEGCRRADAHGLEERKETLYRTLCRPALKPIDGVRDFLAKTRGLAIPMAVATSAGRQNREFVLGSLGLDAYFDAVIGPEEVPRGKPHPGMFLRAAGKLGLPPRRCLVFEDSLAGVEAAGRARMPVVALTTSHEAAEFGAWRHVLRTARDFTALDPQLLLSCLDGAG
jgi:beta-phosphoglucomutase